MIEIITFTGVDAHTDLTGLARIAREYPGAEFGVLFGSQTWKHNNPIFPPVETVRALRNLQGVNTALHLCGQYARRVAGSGPMGLGLTVLARGFGRVQINLQGDAWDPGRVRGTAEAVRRFAEETETGSVILQHRSPWEDAPVDHPRIEYLFDLSEGRGEESFKHWPDPPGGRRAGYAGGLGPRNIHRALEFAERHPESRIWFDMERNIRDAHYRLDLETVWEVCRAAFTTDFTTDRTEREE